MSHLLRATGSENTAEWFEPGWNAPGFTKNGFDALRVDFTAITGPGKMYLLGNSPEADENAKLGTFLADDTYQVVKGASLPIKGHQHAHWFFTHAGKYTMSGVVVGAKTDGDKVSSQPFTMSWDVLKSDDDKRPDPSDDSGEPSAGPSHDPLEEPSGAPHDAAAPKIDDTKVKIAQGHLDVFTGIARNRKLTMVIKDDHSGKAIYRKPEAVTLRIGKNAYRKLPQSMHDRFGPEGYLLAQNGDNQQEVLFPGWDTYGVTPDFGAVDLEFVDVKGSGKVYMFLQGIGKLCSPLASGSWVLASGESISQKKPGHVHTNWLFEKPGTYTMKVRLKGVPVTATDGKAVVSEPVTYTWVVGDRSGSQSFAAPTVLPSVTVPTGQPSAVVSARQLVKRVDEKTAPEPFTPKPTPAPTSGERTVKPVPGAATTTATTVVTDGNDQGVARVAGGIGTLPHTGV